MDGGTDWSQVRHELEAATDELDGAAFDRLATACFWTDDVDASIDHRRSAYRAHAAAGDDDAAGRAAWHLFYEHFLVGETSVANGWRERGHRHVVDERSLLAGWLALADADAAVETSAARHHADRALEIATAHTDSDLQAMALTASGRAAIHADDRMIGLGRLDEAMVAVINDELDPHFTGWVFCNVISTCYAIADLRRASEWSDAALRWCATLRDGHLYPGLCRVYRAEITTLRGDWQQAADDVAQACADLERFDERYAADAHHLRGELARRQGRLDEAAAAFDRARALGGEALPGQALLDAGRGRTSAALAALKTTIADPDAVPIVRMHQLRALLDLTLQAGEVDDAPRLVEAMRDTADGAESPLLDAHVLAAAAVTNTADTVTRDAALRSAIAAFDRIGVPFEAARLRVDLADHLEAAGDSTGAAHERQTADQTFRRLGAVGPGGAGRTSVLTERECEVLALVADGLTNPEIAGRLHLSPHTVNRHVSNIMTKLEVNTRAAASARAVAEGWL